MPPALKKLKTCSSRTDDEAPSTQDRYDSDFSGDDDSQETVQGLSTMLEARQLIRDLRAAESALGETGDAANSTSTSPSTSTSTSVISQIVVTTEAAKKRPAALSDVAAAA